LAKLDVSFRDFRGSSNPPILHRKETLVSVDYPGRDRFARLTAQEEAKGLFDSAIKIGTKSGWEDALGRAGYEVRGHRLSRRASAV
jgi:hypothetical protein